MAAAAAAAARPYSCGRRRKPRAGTSTRAVVACSLRPLLEVEKVGARPYLVFLDCFACTIPVVVTVCCWCYPTGFTRLLVVVRPWGGGYGLGSFEYPGMERPALNGVSLSLPSNSLGLILGASGSGKSTLLHLVAGLAAPTQGQLRVGDSVSSADGGAAQLSQHAGLVFQFPERYFLGETMAEELTFAWPRSAGAFQEPGEAGRDH